MFRKLFFTFACVVFGTSNGVALAQGTIQFQKTVLDTKFRSEGVAVADVNKDGLKDIIAGELWYEAPNWKAHEMQPVQNYGDGEKNYSHTFCVWADDINGDGFVDAIIIDFPGEPCYWLENPRGKDGHWKKHIIWHSACNETPQYVDLFQSGKKGLVMGYQPEGRPKDGNAGQMAFFSPGKDPTQRWEMLPISEMGIPAEVKDKKPVPKTGKQIPGTFRYSHGLGVGDINGDGRLDVLCTEGWWQQPEDKKSTPWKFHPAKLGEACADMIVLDVNGDKKKDVITSSAHRFGIWQFQQQADGQFVRKDLFPTLVSETHALHFKDMNNDGLPDLVTGKRFYSHGRKEPGAEMPAMLYWFKAEKNASGEITFTPQTIDDNSGIGTQFEVTDINGDKNLDIVVSNKKGVFLFIQK